MWKVKYSYCCIILSGLFGIIYSLVCSLNLDFVFKYLKPKCFYSRNRHFRTDPDGRRRENSEIKKPDTWRIFSYDEDFLLDQAGIKQMVLKDMLSSIIQVFAFKIWNNLYILMASVNIFHTFTHHHMHYDSLIGQHTINI